VTASPTITVTPRDGMQDERLTIRIDGVTPGSRVTLRAIMHNMFGPWMSVNTYVGRADRIIDLDRQAPVAGSYQGIDVMGPIWSAGWAGSAPLAPPAVRDITKPNTADFAVLVDGVEVASDTCLRRYIAPNVRRTEIRENGIVGTLFEHTDGIARPGILMMGGSAPLIPEHIAAPMANRGFTVLAIAFFGMGDGTPDELGEIPLEYFQTCARHLLAQPTVTGPRIGLFGASKGGEASPLVAATFPELFGGVVAEAASGFVASGVKRDADGHLVTNWTLHGEGLPFVKPTDDAVAAYLAGDPDVRQRLGGVWESALADQDAAAAAQIPIERADCPILYLNGADDAMWPAHTWTGYSLRRLAAASYRHEVEEVVYQDCGHVLYPPYIPVDIPALKHPVTGMTNAYGGTVAGNARASVDHWSRMIDFYTEHLAKR
jgi:dienelactone hydrolase